MSDKSLPTVDIDRNRHALRYVKEWMKLRGVTQRRMSELLNMSEPTVSKWLSGKVNMTLAQFIFIAELLDAKPEELLFPPTEQAKAKRYNDAAFLAETLDDEAFSAWIAAGRAMKPRD